MSDQRWDTMWELFHECSDLPPDERTARLESACSGDPEMLAEVVELLGEYDRPLASLKRSHERFAGELSPGDLIGPYRIERLVGEGGMGLVYRARQTEPVQRTVALKLIRPGMDSREVISRFQHERQSLALLEHPNIARVHDADATPEGRPYFTMEFVDGIPITTYCLEEALPIARRLELFDAVCKGVQHAHQRGIIHRDLKPSNVLVTEVDGNPVPKIIDFGIARATEQADGDKTFATELGRLIGTPEYMSPEQAGLTGTDVDTRTDVYALGVLLYELMTDSQPFDWVALREKGLDEMRRVIRDENPPRPSARISRLGNEATTGLSARSVAGDLDWIVLKALEKDRERRYGSPSALAQDLERYRNDHPVEARPPSRMYRLKKFTQRHRVGVAAASAVALALVAGITVGAIGIVRAINAGKQAQREAATAERVTEFMTELFARSRPGNEDVNSITVRQVLDEGVKLIADSLDDEPLVRARPLLELGTSYQSLGIYEDAGALIHESLALMEATVGAEHPWTANAMFRRGVFEFETGALADARITLERAVDLLTRAAGDHDPRALLAMETLGNVYTNLGLYAEGRHLAERVLEVYKADPESDPGALGRAYYNLALAMARADDHDAVERTLEKAIDVFERADMQPWVDYALNSLAILYWKQDDFERALPLSRRSYESIRRTHGEEHPYTASMMNNLGLLLIELDRYAESRELSERAYDIRLKVLGPDHADVATSQLNLARLYAETDERERASEFFEEGLDRRAKANGENHATLVRPLRRYASFLEAWGRNSEARPLLERADAIEAEERTASPGSS